MIAKTRIGVLAAFTICSPVTAWTQQLPFALPVPTPGVTSYSSGIPSHEDVFGHEIGQAHTRPDQIVAYFEAVAAASDRVILERHGMTYEGRPLVHAIVSAPQNLERLEEIRAANARLSDDAASVTDEEIARMPVVAYLGYSVHGNEASGSEAALLLLYHLAAGRGPGIDELLNDAVIILDPSLNPDGRDRFVDWVNRNRGRVASADRADREHNEPWPGGRTNHYLFDLNRDWLPAQFPESQGRLEVFHRWRPQLLTDHHEMGGNSTFFFQPGIPSRGNPNTPQRTFDITAEIGEFHGRFLDRIGSLYYSAESFDDFYYGKGSTYPDVNGAIGILFEQASSRALLSETNRGELSYAYTVRNQFTTSLSTLEAAHSLRTRLLRHQRDFYREAAEVARRSPVRAYVFGSADYRSRTEALTTMLLRHRVRVFELARPVELGGSSFAPGSAFVVPMDQPQARLVKAMMERVTEFNDSLFYDVSTWTMPLAFGVPYGEVTRDGARLVGSRVTEVARDRGYFDAGDSPVAYAFRWGRFYSARGLLRLQQAGVVPTLMTRGFVAQVGGMEQRFEPGTVIVPASSRDGSGPSPEELRRLLASIAESEQIEIFPLESGLTPSGVDLGSASARVLSEPSVALLAGRGTSSYRVGEIWHLLNERIGLPVSLLEVSRFGATDLARYNTIILAGYSSGLDDSDVEELKDWVRGGGLLIAGGSSAVSWLIRREIVDLSLKETPRVGDGDTPYGDRSAVSGSQFLSGAIFTASLDSTHPLSYGHPETVAFFKTNRSFLVPSDQAGTNVSRFDEGALLSGYVSEEINALVAGSANIVARRMGGGRVVLFTEDLNFRAFWYGTSGLMLNAVFFGRAF